MTPYAHLKLTKLLLSIPLQSQRVNHSVHHPPTVLLSVWLCSLRPCHYLNVVSIFFNEFHSSAQYFNFVSVVSPALPQRHEEDKQKAKTNNQRTHLKVEAGKCFQMRQYLRTYHTIYIYFLLYRLIDFRLILMQRQSKQQLGGVAKGAEGERNCCSNFPGKCKLMSRYRDITQTLFPL